MALSIFLVSGVRIFDATAAGQVRVPKLVGMTAPSWHGENELISEAEADFGEVTLLPSSSRAHAVLRPREAVFGVAAGRLLLWEFSRVLVCYIDTEGTSTGNLHLEVRPHGSTPTDPVRWDATRRRDAVVVEPLCWSAANPKAALGGAIRN